jgi:DNA invertase Pin-like site-specific DNA recombinase
VAIYARVSTKDKGQEVENQLRQLRKFAAQQGWVTYREYIDHETGSTNDRVFFQQMFDEASRRCFDVVLFWALDRLTREGTLETLQHLNRLSAYGVGFRSFTEAYLDSCGIWKDAIIGILATLAKQERLRVSQRVRAGLDRARAQGKRLGRPHVILDAREIAVLREQGLGWKRIAKQLGCGVSTVLRVAQEQRGSRNPQSARRPSPAVSACAAAD